MDTWCCLLVGGFGALLVLYALFEVHYFLRMCLCVINARFIKRNASILDTLQITGICLTNDVDTLLYHMNNARYLREIDFARVDFYERTKLYKTIVSKGGSVVQGATTIRYRRFIRPLSLFKIMSHIIYWDDQFIYMEHRFVSPVDGFVHCVAICRQRLIGVLADEVINCLLLAQGNNIIKNELSKIENGDVVHGKPDIPLEVAKWIEYNDISSNKLRKDGCC
ncbi:Protein THEM6 [Pseudolycoriella hygida]|uniref:Protein THEM6 n=1 Tax=Pseudolycoriella hygida TaxID=35572 RepID=A0A9Q0S976_9DIPT|nr:Protein THEM6 [Pseudolycoriella hygida]